MRKVEKLPDDFVYEDSNGLKVTFGLSYESRNDPSLAPTFELRMEALDWQEKKKVFEGELEIGVRAHGHADDFRWYADVHLKNGKPLEIKGNNWSHTFRGKGPSFWPTDRIEWKITDLTSEGYRISVPPYSLQHLRMEFFPREIRPASEDDV